MHFCREIRSACVGKKYSSCKLSKRHHSALISLSLHRNFLNKSVRVRPRHALRLLPPLTLVSSKPVVSRLKPGLERDRGFPAQGRQPRGIEEFARRTVRFTRIEAQLTAEADN